MRRQGRQTSLSSALSALSKRLDRRSQGRLLQVRVATEWERVAGPRVAEHTTNAHLRGGELVVHVDSPVWAAELSALAGPYTEAINKALGHTVVKSVRFAVSRKVDTRRQTERAQREAEEFYQPDETVPVPLTELERAQVEASAAAIKDKELREAVVRATIASMEWRKGLRAASGRETPRDGL